MSGNFEDDFRRAIEQIKTDAKEAGTSLTAACKEAQVGRATPDRWTKKPPKTIRLISRMQEIVRKKKEARHGAERD